MIIDMHCHIDLYSNPQEVANECKRKGVYALSVTTTPKAWEGTFNLTRGNKKIRTALGLHPQIVHQRFQELGLFDELLPKAKYVGEIGLDGSKDFKQHWNIQLKAFRFILQKVNNVGGRIMSVHSRSSATEVIKELGGIQGTPILHWFTGTKTDLKKAVNIGCWFSVGPAMLNTKRGKELVLNIPKNKILTETDGPFAKYNGKMLMPWDVEIAHLQLAKIWNISTEESKSVIKSNFMNLLS